MQTITGTVKNGQIALSEPLAWPDGTEVRVRPISKGGATSDEESAGQEMTDDVQADDPESIARWIAEFDAIPPLQMTPAEEAQWQASRNAQRELEKADFARLAARLGDADP
jgi:hypothetical protein